MERVQDEPLVSVIVSVHNAEDTLGRCLRSICGQTYPNLEIIVSDAASTDGSADIARRFAEEDGRIRIVSSSAEHYYTAYNVGIDFSTGAYAIFVDAGDYLSVDTVKTCVDRVRERPAQIVCFGYSLVDENGAVTGRVLPSHCSDYFRGERVQTEFLPRLVCIDPESGIKTGLAMNSHCAMFSLPLINRTEWQFDIDSLSDIYSLLLLYKDVSAVDVVQEALYCYSENKEPTHCRKDFTTVRGDFERDISACRQIGYNNMVEKALRYYFLLSTSDIISNIRQSDLPSKIRRRMLHDIQHDSLLKKCMRQIKNDEMDGEIRETFHRIQKHQRIHVH